MSRFLVAASLCAAAFAGAGAQASTVNTGPTGFQIGRCIVKADRLAAIDLLKTLPLTGGPVDWSSVSLGGAGGCRDAAAAAVTITALRGGLAQELFRRDFVSFGLEPQRNSGSLARFDLPVEKNTMGAEDPAKTLFLTADCVARSNTGGTERLIKAEAGSDLEMKAFQALGPWLSACQGSAKMSYGRTELRSAIVQAAYHVARRFATGEMSPLGAP